jgi:hypothetical protein
MQAAKNTTPQRAPDYVGLKTGQAFLDGAREMERCWLHTARSRGIWRLWWLIYCQLHGIDPTTGAYNSNSELQFVGSQQQYALFRVQLTRRYIQQREMMAKDQRPSFNGVARNNDVAALAEVNIATKAIEYMLSQAHLEEEASEALSSLCNYGGGGLMLGWDHEGGDLVPAMEPIIDENGDVALVEKVDENNQPIIGQDEQGNPVPEMEPVLEPTQKPSGCPTLHKLYPWQMAYDAYMEKNHPAIITKTPVNKYELAAQFPEKYDEIIKLSIDDEMGDDALFAWGGAKAVSSDTIVLRQYFHRNCKAVRGGRWAGYVKDVGLWGVDEPMACPLPKGLPVKIMMGPRYDGTGFGYPESSDLLSLQAVINEVISMCVTNIQKRGNANAYKRDDIQIDEASWSAGGKLIDLPAGAEPPTWDEPPKMDTLSQYILEFCLEQARLMLGSNSVTEGNPEANITSGSFAVLLVNVAQKYASKMQEAYDTAITAIANDALVLTRQNAENGFWAKIAGIGDAPYAQMIEKSRLDSLHSVELVRKSPVLSTFPGRVEMFDRLIKLPKQERADASEMLLNSDMESFAGRDQAQKIRIRKENEWLLQGINPPVTLWDDHAMEGKEHRMQYDKLRTMDPPIDPKALKVWTSACQASDAHLQAHAQALATAPPAIALVAGWAPLGMGAGGASPPQQESGEEQGKPGQQSSPQGGGGPKAPSAPKPPTPPKGGSGKQSEAA